MRKTQTSQSSFLFWFEFIQQGFVFSPWLFLPPWLALHRVRNTDHASFSSDLDLRLSDRAHSAWCLMGLYSVVFTVVSILWQRKSSYNCGCPQPSLKFLAGRNMGARFWLSLAAWPNLLRPLAGDWRGCRELVSSQGGAGCVLPVLVG